RVPSHPERSISSSNLAITPRPLFEQLGDRGDLDSAITLHREALELRPAGHPDRSSSLNNLATALHTRFLTSFLLATQSVACH
ncbi:hypothetical protein FOMPIDRAFT_1111310, partial [Fomitopsis schrenkii]